MQKLRPVIFFLLALGLVVPVAAQTVNLGGKPDKDKDKKEEFKPNVKGQMKKLTKELNLTEDQAIQVKSILEDEQIQQQPIVNNNMLPREVKNDKMHKLHVDVQDKVKEVLNDDQKKKYDELEKKNAG